MIVQVPADRVGVTVANNTFNANDKRTAIFVLISPQERESANLG